MGCLNDAIYSNDNYGRQPPIRANVVYIPNNAYIQNINAQNINVQNINDEDDNIYETDDVTVTYDKKTGNKIVNEFYFLDTIGRGAYSKVKKCINLNTKEEFAVKILNKRLLRKKKKS